jgi:hypothetical protein
MLKFISFLTFSGVIMTKLSIPDDFEDLLYELNNADGLFSALVIYDTATANRLVEKGWAIKTVRGSYASTDIFHDLMKVHDYDAMLDAFVG